MIKFSALKSVEGYQLGKTIFAEKHYFGKYCTMKNIQSLISYKKGYIDFCRQTAPSFQNSLVHPQMFQQPSGPIAKKWGLMRANCLLTLTFTF